MKYPKAVVVRTGCETDFEEKLAKKTRTSGCALGTVFGDIMETFKDTNLNPHAKVHTSWLYALTAEINTTPSLYLEAGAIRWMCAVREGLSIKSIWRMSGAITLLIRSRVLCGSMKFQRAENFSTQRAD